MDDAGGGADSTAWYTRFDEIRGVVATLRQLKWSGHIRLTAELDGVEIWIVRFDPETVQDDEDALVFL